MTEPTEAMNRRAREIANSELKRLETNNKRKFAPTHYAYIWQGVRLGALAAMHRVSPDEDAVEKAEYVISSELEMHFGPAFKNTIAEATKGILRRLSTTPAKSDGEV